MRDSERVTYIAKTGTGRILDITVCTPDMHCSPVICVPIQNTPQYVDLCNKYFCARHPRSLFSWSNVNFTGFFPLHTWFYNYNYNYNETTTKLFFILNHLKIKKCKNVHCIVQQFLQHQSLQSLVPSTQTTYDQSVQFVHVVGPDAAVPASAKSIVLATTD